MTLLGHVVEELREKYGEMLAMRLAEGATDSANGAVVRTRMSALATRFPGALREIDELELAEIQRRLDRLDAILSGAGDVEPWMEAVTLFHRFTRGVLCAKRWLRGRKSVTADLERAYLAEATALAFPHDALAWRTDLAAIASPPQGRVTHLVYARIARELGIPVTEARRLVFGAKRKSREAGANVGPTFLLTTANRMP